MTSARSAPTQANDDVAGLSNVLNTFAIGFSINDFPQLVRTVIKIFLNFPLPLSRSVLMELQKLFMLILFRITYCTIYYCIVEYNLVLALKNLKSYILRTNEVFWSTLQFHCCWYSSKTFLAPFVMMKS